MWRGSDEMTSMDKLINNSQAFSAHFLRLTQAHTKREMNLGGSDKPIHCNTLPLKFQICACCLEKPPSSAMGVVNEVCSRALVWQFD